MIHFSFFFYIYDNIFIIFVLIIFPSEQAGIGCNETDRPWKQRTERAERLRRLERLRENWSFAAPGAERAAPLLGTRPTLLAGHGFDPGHWECMTMRILRLTDTTAQGVGYDYSILIMVVIVRIRETHSWPSKRQFDRGWCEMRSSPENKRQLAVETPWCNGVRYDEGLDR